MAKMPGLPKGGEGFLGFHYPKLFSSYFLKEIF